MKHSIFVFSYTYSGMSPTKGPAVKKQKTGDPSNNALAREQRARMTASTSTVIIENEKKK